MQLLKCLARQMNMPTKMTLCINFTVHLGDGLKHICIFGKKIAKFFFSRHSPLKYKFWENFTPFFLHFLRAEMNILNKIILCVFLQDITPLAISLPYSWFLLNCIIRLPLKGRRRQEITFENVMMDSKTTKISLQTAPHPW